MSEWISIDEWSRCPEMERPGIVFQIRNADGQLLTTRCVVPLPEFPFDWKSAPLEFRAVFELVPQHSDRCPRRSPSSDRTQ